MPTLYILIIAIMILLGWMGYNYWRLKRAATLLENAEFAAKIPQGQLVDLRTPDEFRRKHILGARNIPYEQLKQSLGALRKDKPILIYENDRGQRVTPAAIYLKKQGYKDIYILSYGLNDWDGKVKAG
ncbi:rhodanese-like domain-containing protein [Streptococcus sp. X16XC17]|uniref:rhodanese-like domain-containing protein n=1 Tax=unclassified Streptococcus TaxID=2608887 RepID=UPI00066FDC47|nr:MULTISPECIES: rhodanese-like domain-containing protein [unclassified Streptococcus]TCD46733.1 rhodanese-like domain-containing protein [Streptococcus sp. X16XC17]